MGSEGVEQLHHHVEQAAKGFDGFVMAYAARLQAVSQGDRVAHDWSLPSDEVDDFLNGGFQHLCSALELMKEHDADAFVGEFAKSISDAMLRLGKVASGECRRFGVALRRDFTWSAQILLAVFQPMSFRRKRLPSAFEVQYSRMEFQRKVVDRIVLVLRGLLARLRDSACLIDQKIERTPNPIWGRGSDWIFSILDELVRMLRERIFSCRDVRLDALTGGLARQRRYLCLLAHGASVASDSYLN